MKVSKLEAAKQNLETAIQLFFENRSPVAIHTLTMTAYNVLADVLEKKGKESTDEWMMNANKKTKAEIISIRNNFWNFTKHSRKDLPEEEMDFVPSQDAELLFFSTMNYIKLARTSFIMDVYQVWFISKNRKILFRHFKGAQKNRINQLFPKLDKLSERAQRKEGLRVLGDRKLWSEQIVSGAMMDLARMK